GVQDAQVRLAALQAQVNRRQAQLAGVQRDVIAARDHLTYLENRQHQASTLLARNLVASYKDPDPDIVSIVLNSNGFADALERLNFMRRVERRNQRIVKTTKTARVEVLAEAQHLAALQTRLRSLTA